MKHQNNKHEAYAMVFIVVETAKNKKGLKNRKRFFSRGFNFVNEREIHQKKYGFLKISGGIEVN